MSETQLFDVCERCGNSGKVQTAYGLMPCPHLEQLADPERRDGVTYNPKLDRARLAAQHGRVYDLMIDGTWRTLQEIATHTGDPEASVSARLRDLRKARFGAHTVERRRRSEGTFEYRLLGASHAD